MTTHFGVMRALTLAMALSVPGASIALADSPASLQAGYRATQTAQAPRAVVANNGLCGAQYGAPMADCDRANAAQHATAGAAGGIDYQGFPYNLPSGS
jgi:hypothetical protein